MRARTLEPTFDDLYDIAPKEIKDYIDKCKETPQSPNWHPEGNVYVHMRIVYDRARETGDINAMLVALFHDLGKATTTAKNAKGSWSSYGHEDESAKLAKKYASWIAEVGGNPEEVYEVVKGHMKIKYMSEMRPSKQAEMRNNKYFDKIDAFTEHDNMKTLTDEEMNRYK